jgi:hypothetical protein
MLLRGVGRPVSVQARGAVGLGTRRLPQAVALAARFSTQGIRRPQPPLGLGSERVSLRRVFTRRWSTTVGMVVGAGAPATESLIWSAVRQRFSASVESHSFARQGLMAGFFYCVGDITAQSIEHLSKDALGMTWAYDWRRTARMGTFGLLIAVRCWQAGIARCTP